MSLTPSSMVELGTAANNFELLNTVDNSMVSLQSTKSEIATVIMFICNHCPFVIHLNNGIVELSYQYIPKGVKFIAISSNDIQGYPQDGPIEMKKTALKLGYNFPYLYDETQSVAKQYNATCTPDFFVYDKDLKLVYRGQFDDSRPGNNIPVTGVDLRETLENILNNKPVQKNQKPSIGCNIKWKS